MASVCETGTSETGTSETGTSETVTKILIDKGGIKLIKKGDDNYTMEFYLENPTINLNSLINNNLIKLIYDLNVDLFEHIEIEKKNDYESNIFILFKDLFNEMSLPHYYYYFNLKHNVEENHFLISPLTSVIKKRMECVNLKHGRINYTPLNEHQVQFSIDAVIPSGDSVIATMIEKIICNIIYKIFNRVKHFVSTIKYTK
jgi:hypothetical protein